MKRKLLNVPLAVGASGKARIAPGDDSSRSSTRSSTIHAAGKTPNTQLTSATAFLKQNSVIPKTVTPDISSGALLSSNPPVQGPTKRRKLLLVSRQEEPQPAACIGTPSKSTNCKPEPRKALQSISSSRHLTFPKPHKSIQESAAVSEKQSSCSPIPEALASQTARAAKPPVKNTASPLDGSPPPSATTVAVTPLEKSAQQPPESPAVSTHTNESSGATATKESGPHAAETGLSAPGVRGTLGIPLPSAGSPDSRLTSSHGSSTQSPLGEQTKRLLVKKQQGNKFIKEASPVLPVLTETAAAKATRDATATTCTAPSSMQDRLMEGTDSLLMIRRLPAVLTGSLPTLESLGVQVNLPSGADLLKQLPRQQQGPCAKHTVQQLCHPATVRALQNRLMPQAAHDEVTARGWSDHTTEGDAAFVMQSMQASRLQEMLCSPLLNDGLKLNVPAIVAGGNRPPDASLLPALTPTTLTGEDEQRNKTVAANDDCGQDTARSHMRLKDGVALESGPGVQSLIDQQQNEFADIWSSPEKQAEECSKAYDAFPIVLSYLQAVLN